MIAKIIVFWTLQWIVRTNNSESFDFNADSRLLKHSYTIPYIIIKLLFVQYYTQI